MKLWILSEKWMLDIFKVSLQSFLVITLDFNHLQCIQDGTESGSVNDKSAVLSQLDNLLTGPGLVDVRQLQRDALTFLLIVY